MSEITKYLLTFIKKNFKPQLKLIKQNQNTANNSLLIKIIENIKNAEQQWNKIKNTIHFEDLIDQKILYSIHSSYIPENIKLYLNTKPIIGKKFIFSINNRLNTVNLSYVLDNTNIKNQNINPNKLHQYFLLLLLY